MAETRLRLPDAVTAPGPPRFAPPPGSPLAGRRRGPRGFSLPPSSLLLLPPPPSSLPRTEVAAAMDDSGLIRRRRLQVRLSPGSKEGDRVGALGRGRAERRRTCARVVQPEDALGQSCSGRASWQRGPRPSGVARVSRRLLEGLHPSAPPRGWPGRRPAPPESEAAGPRSLPRRLDVLGVKVRQAKLLPQGSSPSGLPALRQL